MPLSSALDRFLAGMEYPATRDDLLRELAMLPGVDQVSSMKAEDESEV